ncbi:CBS domain-containing protein CBSX1, chloroplastic isoform X4 [Selaginella moellendorffii]|uniref:CBS domain-containing protein CBSX1, chloroplastic isoform X4 n=1 Tax=Selaginella moellendorffii TaxID=88036 RepID=UPI000D1C2DF9|nr:CBS domain-containing protein CBSX1, chloroplastic isoform X4 [Selaginella moellendorffii]XP_002992036.2 CBS domain-containing protein CBSX1, chloroplastic isoform X4 [Selaginella moellendorffii]|eukprot:XP_002964488.2 CBS domain-containing protein CBSX1, chloroplastic isoform X4 [Selaginella moellendorffii]
MEAMAVASAAATTSGAQQQLDRLHRAAAASRASSCDCKSLAPPPPQHLVWGYTNRSLLRRSPAERCAAGATPTMPHSLPSENSATKHDYYTVCDFMTPRKDLFCVRVSTTVDDALKLLVDNRITGLPVIDEDGKLVGVVSDYDLLALDSISGKRPSTNSLFPEAGSTWKAFKEIQHLLTKTQGKTVGDLMTPSPLVVRVDMNIEDAARILLDTKYRRLPVVDECGKLVGLITRGNVVRAALQVKRAAEENTSSS